MRSYIFLILLSISTGVKAQVFTEVDPAVTNFAGISEGNIDWGDYDNDGDLDILLTGTGSGTVSRIYRNRGDGTFENSGVSLPDIYRGQAAWRDYDNDGDLDIVLTGLSNAAGKIARIYRNKGDGTFENSNIPLETTYDSGVAWGDYDNDGYQDLAVTGFNNSNILSSWIYRNKRDGTFENTGITRIGVRAGSQAWADYDNDGDLDLIMTGFSDIASTTAITRIYRNKGNGTFEDSGIPLPQLAMGGLSWGDYDNDGDQDLFIIGRTGNFNYFSKIYRNKGDGTFEDSGIPLEAVGYSAGAWGDYDNDGNLDLVLTGYNGNYINKIYRNKGDGTFEDSGISLPGFMLPSISWGDADNDGDLDLLIAGYTNAAQSSLFINNTITPNTPPTAPTGLQAVPSTDGKSATLSWQKATDAQTAQNGLSYNVYISEQLSPMANITNGYRRVAAIGNAGERTSYTIKELIPGKKYNWSVQAVDAAFAGSAFAAEQQFTTPAFEENVISGLPNVVTSEVCWGDYDNDGDLDVLLMGTGASGLISKIFRNKGDGTFEDSGIPLPGLSNNAAAWGDYDNDGHLDFVITGMLSGNVLLSRIYHNKGDGTFEDSGIPIQNVERGALAWGDYDNDGDLDLVLTGFSALSNTAYFSKIYRNKGDGTFEDSGIPLLGVGYSAVGWGDYDNDGDLDLLLTGISGPASFKIYRNKGDGTFVDSGLNLGGAFISSVAWGDYDNDGDLDFLIDGNSGLGLITKIFRNRGNGTFQDIGAPLIGTHIGSASWGDYDNDGYLDLLITGNENLMLTAYGSRLYRNKGDGTFENTGMPLANVGRACAAWADYNNDGHLDILLSGGGPGPLTRLYKNNHPSPPNTAPQAPTGLQVTLSTDSKSATLTWQKATDAETAQPGLNYNVYVRKASDTLQAPMANMTNGYRRIAAMGNAQINTDTIKGLDLNTTYYWSVQAIDVTFTGSPFAAEQSFVTKNTQTISITNLTATYGDADVDAGASTTSSLPVTLSSNNANVATIVAGKVHITGAGTANITASQAGNGAFTPATNVTVSITVGKKALTVTAVNKTITYGDAIPALTYNIASLVTGDAESMFTTPVSIITNATANVGVYNITASGAVAANYTFTYQPATLTITKKALIVTAVNKTITYGDAMPALTYNIPGLVTGDTESMFTTPVSITTNATASVGVYNITASGAVAANYTFTYQPATLTITKKQLTVTAVNKTITYGDAMPVLTYNIAGLETGDAESMFTTPISITTNATANVGVYNITASSAVAANYNFIYQPATLTITKKQLTVSAVNKTITYGDAIPALTYNIAGLETGDAESMFTTPVSITTDATGAAGVFNITASNAAAANYSFAYQPGTLTVQKATPQISFSAQQATYGDADFNPGATIANGLPITYTSTGVATIVNGNIHITGAGTATITAHQAGNSNYNAATDVPITLTVNKKQLTVTAVNKTITYGDALPALTYNITGLEPTDAESVFTTPISITTNATGDAGIFNITVTAAAADNYDFTYQGATLTIQKATAQISFSAQQSTYGDVDFNPGATITNGLPITYSSANSNVATILNGNIHITGAGTTTITAKQAGNNNYNAAADVPVTLTVNKKQLTVTAADKTKIYGDDLPVFTHTVTGFANGEGESVFNTPVNITTPATATSNVGTYPITPANATANNYLFTYTGGVLSIDKAPSTISFVSLPTKTYGDGDFNPGASISNGLPITYTSTGMATIINGFIHITGAGTATITAKQTGNNNYEAAADVTVILSVNKKGLTVTADNKTKVYGDPNPVFTYTVTGFVFGESESIFTSPLNINSTGINAGTYPITPSNAAADNYSFSYQIATLTIQKATQTITFNALPVKVYGNADFNPGATSSAGLPITYTSDNPNVATIVNGNIHITGAGNVIITATQPGNANYNAATQTTQQLIINKATQTITFGPMASRTTGSAAFDPGATASSGLPITYQIANTGIAILTGNSVSPIRSGFSNIIATQPGNNNYEPAPAITQELEIVTGNTIKVQDAVTPNGDGINDYLLIEGIRQFPDNQLYISNAAGKIVFETKGYNNTNNTFRGFAGSGSTLLTRGVYYYVLFYQGKKQTGFFVLEY